MSLSKGDGPALPAYDEFVRRDEFRYIGLTPMNRSDVIDAKIKSRGATPS